MKPLSEISIKLIAMSMIVIVGIHLLNSFYYTHSHLLPYGTVITHAHPFDTSSITDSFKSHEHLSAELTFLATLIYFLPGISLCFLFASLIELVTRQQQYKILIGLITALYPHLRGPPKP